MRTSSTGTAGRAGPTGAPAAGPARPDSGAAGEGGADRHLVGGAALWKLATWLSPSYPVGAFAYSHGLESAVAAGDVTDAASAAGWIGDCVAQGAGRGDAILLAHAWRAERAGDAAALDELAELALALAPSSKRWLETEAQGAAFAAATGAAWDHELAPQPYPVAVGRAAARHALPLGPTALCYLHAFASNLVSACVRLVPLGPERRPAGAGVAHAAMPGGRGRGVGRRTRRDRRLRLSRRHCGDATRNPGRQAVPDMSSPRPSSPHGPLRVGIGGPEGAGKATLTAALCRPLRGRFSVAAITDDIYTREDAEALLRCQALPSDRIAGVETGGCPHTAIREDASINLAAVADLRRRHPDLDIVFIESGGDNLAATFSPELADLTLYVIDVAAGEEIPRKGGPAITRSDLLIINKTDLTPHVGASLEVMERDARRMRRERPFLFSELRRGRGVDEIAQFVLRADGVQERGGRRRLIPTARDGGRYAGRRRPRPIRLQPIRLALDLFDHAQARAAPDHFPGRALSRPSAAGRCACHLAPTGPNRGAPRHPLWEHGNLAEKAASLHRGQRVLGVVECITGRDDGGQPAPLHEIH